jgi:hypothetical protein
MQKRYFFSYALNSKQTCQVAELIPKKILFAASLNIKKIVIAKILGNLKQGNKKIFFLRH